MIVGNGKQKNTNSKGKTMNFRSIIHETVIKQSGAENLGDPASTAISGAQLLMQLYDMQLISGKTLLESLGFDYEEECVLRKRNESCCDGGSMGSGSGSAPSNVEYQ